MSETMEALRRPGWLTFAAVIMFTFAGLRVITAISFLADSTRVANLSGGLFGDHIFWWGVWDLIIAVLALYAGYSLLEGHAYGRVFAYLWAAFLIIESFLEISWAPWYGAGSIAVGVLVIYAVSTTSDYSTRPT